VRRRNYSAGLAGLALIVTLMANAQTPAPASSAPPAAANPRGTPTTMVVKFRVKAGKNAEFEKAFREMQAGVRAHEPGNVYYDFFIDNTDPQLYVIVERYKDADAVAAHGKTDHAKKMLATIRELMEGPPEFERLILISAKQQ
jgi:quinol monooxygenase YgiN